MKRNHSGKDANAMRMELKYCEHCGGLWVREGGAGVYCGKCQDKVSELPIPKKKPGKVRLPSGSRTVVDGFPGIGNETDLEAAGGVA